MNKKIKLLITSSLIASSTLIFSGCNDSSKTLEEFTPMAMGNVLTEKATKGNIAKTENLSATIAYDKYEIVSLKRSTGIFKKLNCQNGQSVKKGDVLAEFDTSEAEIVLKQAEVIYAKVKSQYDSIVNNPKSSQLDKDNAKSDLEAEELNVQSAKNALNELTVVAPCDGRIDFCKSELTPGKKVAPLDPICMIGDVNSRILVSQVNGTEFLKLGMSVKSGDGAVGKIIGLLPTSPKSGERDYSGNRESVPGNVIFQFDKKFMDTIKDNASVEVCLENKENVIKISTKGIREYNNVPYVKIKKGDDKIEKFVTLGIKTDKEVEVLSGIDEGDEIIVDK